MVGRALEDHHKLIPAHAADHAQIAHKIDQPLTDRHQQHIPRIVTMQVIHAFEAVEVHPDDRDRHCGRVLQQPLQMRHALTAIGQAGERVMQRNLFNSRFSRLAGLDHHTQILGPPYHEYQQGDRQDQHDDEDLVDLEGFIRGREMHNMLERVGHDCGHEQQ